MSSKIECKKDNKNKKKQIKTNKKAQAKKKEAFYL